MFVKPSLWFGVLQHLFLWRFWLQYLFTIPFESNFTRIINQGPWNVRDSLLLLQPWSPDLAIDEVKLLFCSFWVQVHNLPHQYMTTKNAIRIVKGIGNLLELDNKNTVGRWPYMSSSPPFQGQNQYIPTSCTGLLSFPLRYGTSLDCLQV
jgi:hypothetical protein